MLSRPLTASIATPLVLAILSEGESYGYEILCRVRELSDDQLQWKDGMLYPLLRRLEEQGLIESFWRDGEGERQRRYYRLRAEGRSQLEEEGRQWQVALTTLSKVWKGVPCPTP